MGWLKDFFTNIFGNFWGKVADLAMKFLLGPVVYYLFGPIYKLSGLMVEKILSMLQPVLGDVGVTFEGVGGWMVDILRIQESLSMFLTFLVLGMTIMILKKVF